MQRVEEPNKWKEARPLFLLPQARMVRERMANASDRSVHITSVQNCAKKGEQEDKHVQEEGEDKSPQKTNFVELGTGQKDFYHFPMTQAPSLQPTASQSLHNKNSMLSNDNPNIPNVNSVRPKIFTQQQTDQTTQAPNISNVISNRKICVKINKARCDSCRPLNGVRGSVSRPASATPFESIKKLTLLPREELVTRLKAAEKRLEVFQGELNNCKERLRATSELLQIANDGHALPLQHLALLEQKMREGERRAEVAQLHEEVSHERSKRLLVERQREQERVEHDRALHRLESELSALRISAKHDQSERERTIVDKLKAEIVMLRDELMETQRVHMEELLAMQQSYTASESELLRAACKRAEDAADARQELAQQAEIIAQQEEALANFRFLEKQWLKVELRLRRDLSKASSVHHQRAQKLALLEEVGTALLRFCSGSTEGLNNCICSTVPGGPVCGEESETGSDSSCMTRTRTRTGDDTTDESQDDTTATASKALNRRLDKLVALACAQLDMLTAKE